MNCANHPDREHRAFCQNCGKPLCAECARIVGQAVFCEPCLAARLAGTPGPSFEGWRAPESSAPPASSTRGFQEVPGAAESYQYSGAPSPAPPAQPPAGTPNPALAFALGFVPGVGAMYNGQYAKGVVHLIIFAVLVSLSDQNGIFGIFVAGWIVYQAIEAHHTARARRDGTPLPNPFGLNDIGDRLGFGRNWPSSSSPQTSAPPPVGWAQSASPGAPPPPPPSNPYAAPGAPVPPPGAGSWGAPAETYTAVPPGVEPIASDSAYARFPVGALVLIGLGVLFLLGNSHWLSWMSFTFLLPTLLIGFGGWLFFRRMLATGSSLADDGTPGYRSRLVRALQGSVWVVLVGILFLLDNLHILTWSHSWPLFIIVGGLLALLQRSAAATWVPPAAYGPAPGAPVPPPATPNPGTSIVPHDREGL